MKSFPSLIVILLASSLGFSSTVALARSTDKTPPLVIQEQGSLTVGGTVKTEPGTFDPLKPMLSSGQTFHGDHAYAFYQTPVTAIKNPKVKAIVAFEPGSGFVFPEGEVPAPMPSSFDTLQGVAIPLADFNALIKIPIVIYYGDNIPTEPTAMPAQDSWRVRLAMAKLWRDTVNRHGGNVTLVHLPEIGIKGNTHFPFSDLNNVQIADLVSQFLTKNRLDK